MMHTILYQFPVSHYCEKARWALDYKKVPYQTKNLLPGLHRRVLRGKVPDTTLPVLHMDGQYIQGSDRIIDFLDHTIDSNSLTPTTPEQRAEAESWESFASSELASPYAVFYYSHMLANPGMLRKKSIQNGPWYAPLYYAIIFKILCERIRKLYDISNTSAGQSRERIQAGLQKLEKHLQSRSYLVGNQFTRADLSVAALLSHFAEVIPSRADSNSTTPAGISDFRAQLADSPAILWVKRIYQTHRK